MTKKIKKIVIFAVIIIILGWLALMIYFLFEPKPYQDYTGFKDAKIREVRIKIPEHWQINETNDNPYFYEEIDGKHRIYFVFGEPGESYDIYTHPFLGKIKLQKQIESWSYISLGQGMIRGEYTTEKSEIKELYTIGYLQKDFYLLSCETIDQDTAKKIFYSIY